MGTIWWKNKQDKDLITDRDAKSTAYDEKIRPGGTFYSGLMRLKPIFMSSRSLAGPIHFCQVTIFKMR
jgi:hypothetical protein